MEAETIIENIQSDAVMESENRAAEVAETGTVMVMNQVGDVSLQLEEHAETSEERHDEILEGTQWIKTRLDELLMNFQTMQAAVMGMLTAMQAQMTAQAIVSTDSPRSIQTPLEPEVLPEIVEPASAEDRPAAEENQAPPAKRRRKVI